MVEFNDEFYGHAQSSGSVARWTRRLIGIASLIALPGIWIATQDALPEARLMGLGLSVVLMGVAGLCFVGRR